jgi:uncharacterized membrane-anchored protein
MKHIARIFTLISLVISTSVLAQEEQQGMTIEEFEASLNFQQGQIELPNNLATLDLPATFRYLDPNDTERVLVDAWGNPAGDGTLGMLVPAETSLLSNEGWGVIITYDNDGHVSDDEADSIDYNELLQNMQEETREANKQRSAQGYESLELVGWAEPPFYDKANHKLHWAKELHFGSNQINTLNYNVRVLGREGVLVLNAVSEMNQLSSIKEQMKDVVAFTNFNDGQRYSDFNASTDKVAAYGLAALVAGGVAAKTGLFAKLIAMLIAAKKLVLLALGAIVVWITRLFKGRSGNNRVEASSEQEP